MPLPYEDLIKFSNSSEDRDNENNVTGVDNDSAKFESDIYLFLKDPFQVFEGLSYFKQCSHHGT